MPSRRTAASLACMFGRMPKTPPKGHLARKPPEPSTDQTVIERWIADSMPKVQPLLTHIDRLIRETLPSPQQYAVKWGKAYYGIGGHGWVIELAAYHKSVNVVFLAGAELDPEPPLGNSGPQRYVKLHSVEEAEDPQLRDWIAQSAGATGWRQASE
ncbi:MAG: hypothetical protein KatS3mg008_1694 [Acidimicrobiales bacterium]|nr:MAG: hypothetical protein KatS3mg008_1694 [Acidimicrobiales bacterium]